MKFAERLSSLGFSTYSDYLRGEHWRRFKADYKASGRSMKCAVCEWTKIQLHHHTYERLGCERVSDVTPLCRFHHTKVHELLEERNWFVESTFKVVEILKGVPVIKQNVTPKKIRPTKKERRELREKQRIEKEARLAKKKEQARANVVVKVAKVKPPRGKKSKPLKEHTAAVNKGRQPSTNPYLRAFLMRK